MISFFCERNYANNLYLSFPIKVDMNFHMTSILTAKFSIPGYYGSFEMGKICSNRQKFIIGAYYKIYL